MSIKVTTLVGRYAGYGRFKYLIESVSNFKTGYPMGYVENIKIVIGWRKWCWETFGPGIEREWVTQDSFRGYEYRWCWHSESRECKIYLQDDSELAWFKLRWEGDND